MAAKWTDAFVQEADGASVYEPSSLFACLEALVHTHLQKCSAIARNSSYALCACVHMLVVS